MKGLKIVAEAVEVWLMTNTNLEVEKIVDLKEFIINLDKPRVFISEDGTVTRINNPSEEHSVTIMKDENWLPMPSSKQVAELIVERDYWKERALEAEARVHAAEYDDRPIHGRNWNEE